MNFPNIEVLPPFLDDSHSYEKGEILNESHFDHRG